MSTQSKDNNQSNGSEAEHLVEVRPNEFEAMSNKLVDSCKGDTDIAGFFHCLGKALGSKDNKVDSKYLKTHH